MSLPTVKNLAACQSVCPICAGSPQKGYSDSKRLSENDRAERLDVVFLIPFAAGNFLYIGAADLIPEIKKGHDIKTNALHFIAFTLGILLLLALRFVFPHG